MKFFASCGKGLEYLLVEELQALGCEHASAAIAGANATGSLADAQRGAIVFARQPRGGPASAELGEDRDHQNAERDGQ